MLSRKVAFNIRAVDQTVGTSPDGLDPGVRPLAPESFRRQKVELQVQHLGPPNAAQLCLLGIMKQADEFHSLLDKHGRR